MLIASLWDPTVLRRAIANSDESMLGLANMLYNAERRSVLLLYLLKCSILIIHSLKYFVRYTFVVDYTAKNYLTTKLSQTTACVSVRVVAIYD